MMHNDPLCEKANGMWNKTDTGGGNPSQQSGGETMSQRNWQSQKPVRLTKREIEVLSLIAQGRSSQEVADALFVSKRTVDFHLANIYEKLNVNNRVKAFRRAAQMGLIPVEVFFSDSGD
jgi:DNA-binding CsgD family transcriptional regulator